MGRPKQVNHKNIEHQQSSQYKKILDPKLVHKNKDRCNKCGDSAHLEGFQCPVKKNQCKSCHKFGHYTSLCFQRIQQKQAPYKSQKLKAHQLKAGTIFAQDSVTGGQSEDFSTDDSFCLQMKVQCTPTSDKNAHTPAWLITNLAYRLKQHQTRKLYLRA